MQVGLRWQGMLASSRQAGTVGVLWPWGGLGATRACSLHVSVLCASASAGLGHGCTSASDPSCFLRCSGGGPGGAAGQPLGALRLQQQQRC